MNGKLVIFLAVLFLLIPSIIVVPKLMVSQNTPKLYVAFVWHYHQPWYYNENETGFVLPWVRMHSVGNYYKMAYILSHYGDIKVTFDFSGSLIVQLQSYVNDGLMDYREQISWKIANGQNLTDKEIYDMLRIPGGFFDINWQRIVEQVPRFKVLRDTAQQIMSQCQQLATSTEELYHCVATRFAGPNREYYQRVIDLAVLFNLYWIDPEVAHDQYPQVYQLQQKGYQTSVPKFTLDDLKTVLNAQKDIMSKIIPLYRQLAQNGQAEVMPVPYSHPLAPIVADFGWDDDIKMHIQRSIELFNQVFGTTPIGVWPAEEAVNDYVLKDFAEANIKWTITDQSILAKTGVDASDVNNYCVPWYADYNGKRIYVVFRNTEISNLISFKYAGWDTNQAVNDLANRITSIANQAAVSGQPRLLVIALDGENPWEYYVHFGDDFLNTLYQKLEDLQNQGIIQTTTPGEFINSHPDVAKQLPTNSYSYLSLQGVDIANMPPDSYGDAYGSLPRQTVTAHVPEGSWAGGELSIWIGDRQENSAWMWLRKAREDIMNALGVTSIQEAYQQAPQAVEYLLRAEASDWFWWYGGDGGGSPYTFDPLYKAFLRKAYENAGLTPPPYLKATFYPDGESRGWMNSDIPRPLPQPITIDGNIDNEWISAISSGTALNITVGSTLVKNTYLAVDTNGLYLAFIPWNTNILHDSGDVFTIYLSSPRVSVSPYSRGYNVYPENTSRDVGVAIVYMVKISPATHTITLYKANGNEGYDEIGGNLTLGVNNVAEAFIPWSSLGYKSGDPIFLSIVDYQNGHAVETSTRLDLTYKILATPSGGGPSGKVVFEMNDPEGDDDGAGGYQYPKANVFKPGVFDMLKYRVIDMGDKIRFEVTVKDLGDNPWGGPNGFCLQYVQIYIHTKLDAQGRTDTYGLNVTVANDSAWHVALLLAPGWGTDPVPDGQRAAIYYYNNTVVVQGDNFKVGADEITNTIYAEVDKSLLPDISDIESWRYVVAVTSYDGYGPMKVRAFSTQAQDWVVGAPGDNYPQAILNGVLPRIMDLLAPTADAQHQMLHSFNPDTHRMAVVEAVPYVGPTTTTPTTTPSTTTQSTTPSTTTSPQSPTTTTPAPTGTQFSTSTSATPSGKGGASGILLYSTIAAVVIIVVAVVAYWLLTRKK